MNDVLPLCISFSGGRSSAVMTKLLIDEYRDKRPISITFCNTGLEHEATLDFVDECDRRWNLGVVWLEAVVGTEGEGIRHKIADYRTASRNGEPFESVIAKHGIPNAANPHCTARLKVEVMESYIRSLGPDWKEAETAIGIRADEIDRMSTKYKEKRIIYPLIDRCFTKSMVNAFMERQEFDLKIPNDAYGNCVTCWKKADRKLYTIALENPQYFDFFRRMEQKYGHVKTEGYAAVGPDGRRQFFRRYRTVDQIIAEAHQKVFLKYRDQLQRTIFDELLDVGGACDQGCEVYSGD